MKSSLYEVMAGGQKSYDRMAKLSKTTLPAGHSLFKAREFGRSRMLHWNGVGVTWQALRRPLAGHQPSWTKQLM